MASSIGTPSNLPPFYGGGIGSPSFESRANPLDYRISKVPSCSFSFSVVNNFFEHEKRLSILESEALREVEIKCCSLELKELKYNSFSFKKTEKNQLGIFDARGDIFKL